MSRNSHAYARCQAYIDSNFVESPRKRIQQPLALTISRQVYSRSHAIAELLIRQMDKDKDPGEASWALFDKDLVQEILRDHHLPNRLAKYMPEDRDRALSTTINEILGVHPSIWDLFHYTCDTIRKLAIAGNVVLIGRGAHIVTRGLQHILRVRIISPMEKRIERASEIMSISRADASRKITREDQACAAYIKYNFNESIDNPANYDMILNTGSINEQSAAEILHHALLALRFDKFRCV